MNVYKKNKRAGEKLPLFFFVDERCLNLKVSRLCFVVSMEKVVRLLSEGLAEPLVVESHDVGVLV